MRRLMFALIVLVAVSCDQGGDGSATGSTADTIASGPTSTGTTGTTTEPPPTAAVPQVDNVQLDKARRELERAGFEVQVAKSYSSKPAGIVLSQDPQHGTAIEVGAIVSLVVAKPLPQIPDVVGLTVAKAQRALREAGYEFRVVRSGTSGTPGTVIAQMPSPGTEARPGRQVKLTTPNCTMGYSPCLPPASDYDCAGGSGDGPKYTGFVRVTGSDPYGLDADNDGYGCE
jgi:hypothetical protein